MKEDKENLNNKQNKKRKKIKEHKQSKHPKLKLISLIIVVLILLVIDSIIIYNKLYEKHLLDMHFEASKLTFLLVERPSLDESIETIYYIFGKNGICQGCYYEIHNPSEGHKKVEDWGWGYTNIQSINDTMYMEYTGNRGLTIDQVKKMHSSDNIIRMIEF